MSTYFVTASVTAIPKLRVCFCVSTKQLASHSINPPPVFPGSHCQHVS